jgi:hypothetical protein
MVALAAASSALAEDAPRSPEPASATRAHTPPNAVPCVFERYVAVAGAAGFDPELAEEVRKDLAAELSPRGFGVCPSRATQGELVAEVALVQQEPALVSIQVEDYTTGKRVARDVRLGRIPAGGLALAIAIAADELLRASWAELMLRRRQAPPVPTESEPEPTPEAVREGSYSVVSWRSRSEPVPAALAFALNYAHSSERWDGFGLDARLQLRPLRYGFFELGAGGVLPLPVERAIGTTRAAGVLALITLGGCGEPSARVVLCGGARGTFQWTRFRGTGAAAGNEGLHDDATSFVVSGLVQAQWQVAAHFFLLGELTLGGAALSAVARGPDGSTLVAIEGLIVGAALGMGYAP